MGYDSLRFVNEVDEELKCPICCCVLKDALQAPDCEHTFCNDCINEWLLIQSNCPVDRQPLNKVDLKPAPRVLRNFLAKLDIKCDFASFGCPAVVKLESLTSHCNECDFNPDKPVICEKGCGLVLLRNQVEEHNCLSDLRELVSNQQKQINELKTSKRVQEELLVDLKSNLKRLQDQDINEQQRQIHTLQQQVNKLQQHIESLQKQQQYLAQQQQQRSQSPIEVDDDCDCDTCDPTPRSCLFVSGSSRKRTSSWKDTTPLAKRSPSVGKSYPLDSPSSVLDSDHLRHNYYYHSQQHHHQHQSLSPLSPVETRESQIHQQLITFYGTIITVNISDDETIESLKTKMELKEGIKCDQQLLFFAGQQLEDDKTLCFYNITSDSSRHLVLRLRDGMKIYVKTLSDKTIEVQVDPSETIEIVKVKIHEQEGISPCDQRLLLDGRDLADLRTLSDYGIKHKTTLQLDLHLGGPCPICQTQFKNNSGKVRSNSPAAITVSTGHHNPVNGGKHD